MKEELPKRLLILGSTAVFLVLGLIGVSGSRDIAARYGNIQIPVAWYLFPIVLAVLVVASALLLPAAVLRWRRGVVMWLLFLVTVLLGSTSPLLYIIYDFEHRLSSSSPPINAVERTASQPTGSRVKAASGAAGSQSLTFDRYTFFP
jgi:hypothetical protein